MPDLYQNYGTDLTPGPSGDLLTVDGTVLGQQRVLRRLMTNQGSYIWHVDYGAGLPQFIGQPASAAQIHGIVQTQMLLEEAVAQSPPPSVNVSYYPDGTFFVSISYTDAQTGTPLLLSFDVNQ
jgi:phage baseplate assembly protein W